MPHADPASPQPVFRFAPSPNGALHLGHAYSALLNQRMARAIGGKLLLRIEDIDTERCTPALETATIDDLRWLGLHWQEPVRRQSEHFDTYKQTLDRLIGDGLAYPAFLSRGEAKDLIAEAEREGTVWPRDPDGTPLYPGRDRDLPHEEVLARIAAGAPFAWRLDIEKALSRVARPLGWREMSGETISADPRAWGDVVLARRDTPASYHLCVVVDDALQGVSHVVRGRDLYAATSIHRLLQELLGLAQPVYHHHELILDDAGRKLSKRFGDTALGTLREGGATPDDIRRMVGLGG